MSTYGGGIISTVGNAIKGYSYYDNSTNSMVLQGYTGVNVALWPNSSTLPTLIATTDGKVGIGTTSPGASKLKISFDGNIVDGLTMVNTVSGGGTWVLGDQSGTGGAVGKFAIVNSNVTGVPRMVIDGSGYVGIGTTSPDEMLSVDGTVHSKEVRVALSGLPDFVFDKEYHLPTLSEVKTYVDKNHHLPDVPSAAEVERNGLKLGEMNATLLKKVEELTLYIIQQKDDSERQIAELKQQISEIKKTKR